MVCYTGYSSRVSLRCNQDTAASAAEAAGKKSVRNVILFL